MAVVGVVLMVAVYDRFVPAALAVYVVVVPVGLVRQGVLVVVAVMIRVRVALVDVVNMTFMLDGRVPAPRSVRVIVRGVDLMRGTDLLSSTDLMSSGHSLGSLLPSVRLRGRFLHGLVDVLRPDVQLLGDALPGFQRGLVERLLDLGLADHDKCRLAVVDDLAEFPDISP
jgi:hypothetical protein